MKPCPNSKNSKVFGNGYYRRIPDFILLALKTAESQPVASNDVLNLLYKSISSTEAALDGSIASLEEIQRNWSY
jgi:hypothetical protein